MAYRSLWIRITKLQGILLLGLSSLPLTLHASFIESSVGAAVVNDATAAFYNPAALIVLKRPQVIPLGSIAYSRTQFTGQYRQANTAFTASGSSISGTHYYLPSFYLGLPVSDRVTLGFAVVANSFNRDLDDNSLLRYAQSNNSIQGIDFVPAAGFKINQYFSVGASINLSYAKFLMRPIYGYPSLNIPDSQSRNDSRGSGVGGDVGFLYRPAPATVIGFNYRSAVTYRLSGTSSLEGNPAITSEHYHFNFWTPAKSVLSINHFVTPAVGFIATIQRIQWSIFKEINVHGIAAKIGNRPVIVNATAPYHLHDAWLLTLGTHYRMSPKWIIRVAGTFNQSPGNPHYQISNGDSIILGSSVGYEVNKNIIIDGSYAHVFMQNENIRITTGRNIINGVNDGSRDGVSLKLTFNL